MLLRIRMSSCEREHGQEHEVAVAPEHHTHPTFIDVVGIQCPRRRPGGAGEVVSSITPVAIVHIIKNPASLTRCAFRPWQNSPAEHQLFATYPHSYQDAKTKLFTRGTLCVVSVRRSGKRMLGETGTEREGQARVESREGNCGICHGRWAQE